METLRLSADMRPKIADTYTVEGTYTFPIDMLRYDTAYPVDNNSVGAIYGDELNPARRRVKLFSYKSPTPDRWASVGWKVLEG